MPFSSLPSIAAKPAFLRAASPIDSSRRSNPSRRQFLATAAALALADEALAWRRADDDACLVRGSIPQAMLVNCLSRSIAMPGLWSRRPADAEPAQGYSADLCALRQLAPKHVAFVCDASWDGELGCDAVGVLDSGRLVASDLHAIDGDIIVGAACHERVGPAAGGVRIPEWVFDAMRLPYEERSFHWERMGNADRTDRHWRPDSLAIDITRIESRMWYYFWSRSYIDLGVEHMHFGDLASLTRNDGPGFARYRELLAQVRGYAARHARRGMILISAEQPAPPRTGDRGHA